MKLIYSFTSNQKDSVPREFTVSILQFDGNMLYNPGITVTCCISDYGILLYNFTFYSIILAQSCLYYTVNLQGNILQCGLSSLFRSVSHSFSLL